METTAQNPENWLSHFRLTDFRPGQGDVVQSLLAGRDCMCIMPTGGGKSLCYQLPAVMREGIVLVISPLIALMKDQVDTLQSLGLRATYINSSLDAFEQSQRLHGMEAGQFDLVYIAPERLRSARFLQALSSVKIQLLAVDEAHCISEWGHDFRPDYARIGQFREKLGHPQTIALTATATPLVRSDVIAQLHLRSPEVFVTGFARPNLRFEVLDTAGQGDKTDQLLDLLDESPGPAIVYASTRKKCESVVELLRDRQKVPVGLYHAGLTNEDRRTVQDDFMAGRVPIIVATNAFGMGIDKRDLRLVVHFNMPGSLEAYYQEAGRAGRDGLPSRCVLLFTYQDRYIQEFFIENKFPSREAVARVYDLLRQRPEDPIELTLEEIKTTLGLSLSSEGVGVCERLLEKCGVLERLDSQQNLAQVKLDTNLPTLVDLLAKEAKVQRRVLRELERVVDDRRGEWVPFQLHKVASATELDRESLNRALRELTRLSVFGYVPPFRGRAIRMLRRDLPFRSLDIDFVELQRRKTAEMDKLERVIAYAQTRRCRQQEILHYFGDSTPFRCDVCDRCQPNRGKVVKAMMPAVAVPHEKTLQAVRIVLSGAARARGSIGKTLLAKMLCGSRSAQMAQLRLDKLSTFGLLTPLTQPDVVEFIEALIACGLLDQSEKQPRRPLIVLTELGNDVMRGKVDLPESFSITPGLALRLRGIVIKESLANAANRAAAPVAAAARADTVPRTSAPVESPRFDPAVAQDVELVPSPKRETISHPDHYWTWRLLEDGYTVQECLAIRGIDEERLMADLAMAVREGFPIDVGWNIDALDEALLAVLARQAPAPDDFANYNSQQVEIVRKVSDGKTGR